MNIDSIFNTIPPIRHDMSRLRDFMSRWREADPAFSRLFLANGILEHTASVTRHLDSVESVSEFADTARRILDDARDLLALDPSIAACALEHLDPSMLARNIRNLKKRYDRGEPFEGNLDDEAFQAVDMLFSFELILETLNSIEVSSEDTQNHREDLNWAAAECRVSLEDALFANPDLARLVEAYARAAAGGPDRAPWPEILANAPDPIRDAVEHDEYFEYSKPAIAGVSQFSLVNRFIADLTSIQLIQPIHAFAADSDKTYVRDPDRHPAWLLARKTEFEVELIQTENFLHILYSGSNIDRLAQPIVTHDGKPIKVSEIRTGFKPSKAFRIDEPIDACWNKTDIEIGIPGVMPPRTIHIIYKAGHEPR